MKKRLSKITITTLTSLLLFLSLSVLVNVNAMSYNYDYFKNVVPSAEGLSYDSTYYSNSIPSVDPNNKELIPMNDLRDMEVYGEQIYILNAAASTKVVLRPEEKDASGEVIQSEVSSVMASLGQIIILNQQFQWISIQEEFPFSQEFAYKDENGNDVTVEDALVNMLNDYYGFNTPLDSISPSTQYNDKDDLLHRAPYIPYSEDETRHALRFRSPEGLTVTKDGIYVADTGGNQIVFLELNESTGIYEVSNIYVTPDDTSFYQVSSGVSINDKTDNGTLFRPTKVAVDRSGRVYCIAKEVYEGIIEYGKPNVKTRTGVFNRFLGKNEVVANPLKAFWSNIFSEAQLSSLTLDLPPMFTNITMDNNGEFLYATSLPDDDAETGTTQANMVKAINTAGKDVMKRNGYVSPNGDALYTISSNDNKVIVGASTLKAVCVNDYYGIFTILDSKRGRLFTYDMEGNLLYITGEQPGGEKTQSTEESMAFCLANPIAVDYFTRTFRDENNNIIQENGANKVENLVIVLDAKSCSIVVYRTTDFGNAVNIATKQYIDGEVIAAEEQWREVIKINTNYELAYLGIGKSILRSATTIEEYQEAMEYFENAHSAQYYSKAFSLYRDAILRKYFSVIMTVGAILVVAIVARKVYKYIKRKRENPYADQGGDE